MDIATIRNINTEIKLNSVGSNRGGADLVFRLSWTSDLGVNVSTWKRTVPQPLCQEGTNGTELGPTP
jgi:hypothetical protein